jgi:glyceraldehyde-3-phosphate dehydrogenase (ferredoxin)
VPKFETGGTFGVNMYSGDDHLFSYNYASVYASDAQRLEQHSHFILDHYLKQFNIEIIQAKNFDHCGEPCAVACKKYSGEFKKDYEPYAALGINCGVFDQRAAEKLNKFVDSMGLDSIQTGGTLSWIMELVASGLIPPVDFGLPPEGPRFQFASRPDQFDLVADSAFNAEYAIAILKMILFSPPGAPFREGMRSAAKWLDARYGIRSIDRAVYNAHGENGCMVPNQYWVPGMFSPMPMMGKYFSYYENNFLPPYELGHKNVERIVYELYSENSGACRFHRKWVEDIIDDIILSHFDLDIDYWASQFKLARAIHEAQSSGSAFWESERVVDIIQGFLEKWQRDGLQDADLLTWIERFKTDKWKAAREFWDDLYRGMADAFKENFPEPDHKEHEANAKK